MSLRPSSFDNPTGRQSPFRRQNSHSPATNLRVNTPGSSPTKVNSTLSPSKPSGLSPEKNSPFVRRPSQISHASERPSSPFARPSSSLSIPASPSRKTSNASQQEASPSPSPLSPLGLSSTSPVLDEPDTRIASPLSPSPLDGTKQGKRSEDDSRLAASPTKANLRPVAQRTMTSSTATTVQPPTFKTQAKPPAATLPRLNAIGGGGAYNHIPQPLLHSMRESFEVLDSNNTGSVNAAAVGDMLNQMGMDNTPASLKNFFPPSSASQLNLSRYLDVLAGPLAELSQPDELKAAFEAFDVDDSGQIDISTLRDALLHTAPQPGEDMIRLSEADADGILGEFTSRRAFGSKGLHQATNKGGVFRYRDFMANVSGGGAAANAPDATVGA